MYERKRICVNNACFGNIFINAFVCSTFIERRWLRERLLFRNRLQKIQRSHVTWVVYWCICMLFVIAKIITFVSISLHFLDPGLGSPLTHILPPSWRTTLTAGWPQLHSLCICKSVCSSYVILQQFCIYCLPCSIAGEYCEFVQLNCLLGLGKPEE